MINGRNNVFYAYEVPNDTNSTSYVHWLFGPGLDRIHRIIDLFHSDPSGRGTVTHSADRIPAISQRLGTSKTRITARADRSPRVCEFNLALTTSVAGRLIA